LKAGRGVGSVAETAGVGDADTLGSPEVELEGPAVGTIPPHDTTRMAHDAIAASLRTPARGEVGRLGSSAMCRD
jgi:hypothetical protein